jgi:hypothetical protein
LDRFLRTLFRYPGFSGLRAIEEGFMGSIHARRTSVLLVALLVAVSPVQAADSLEPTQSNWTAPPYWAPPTARAAEAAASGMSALTTGQTSAGSRRTPRRYH